MACYKHVPITSHVGYSLNPLKELYKGLHRGVLKGPLRGILDV